MSDRLLGVDVGAKRIGLATAHADVRLSHPLTTVLHDDTVMARLQDIIHQEGITRLVIGLPRGMQGQATAQTAITEQFAAELATLSGLPYVMQDEALTSVQAEAELAQRGATYAKAEVDALAATYILQDYLESAHV